MEDLLESIVDQNERILSVLEQISEKLDVLSSIEHEMQWHKELTTASRVIDAIRDVSDAVSSQ